MLCESCLPLTNRAVGATSHRLPCRCLKGQWRSSDRSAFELCLLWRGKTWLSHPAWRAFLPPAARWRPRISTLRHRICGCKPGLQVRPVPDISPPHLRPRFSGRRRVTDRCLPPSTRRHPRGPAYSCLGRHSPIQERRVLPPPRARPWGQPLPPLHPCAAPPRQQPLQARLPLRIQP
ncbi:hypothetical protein Micbo1qcDRAFT_68770 [Microdochium bolleyi]|uniref:Uncharacterized protein n=1 Tax=Microdochium bolleyi TaxID=196109 RepID=A0A136J1R3_9PEZI|nr:hypothetical protein Micbo1qcDRAFT_68770 [Microdochium bolleyi]